ncbi:MAG: 50S ribosomal protein L10 [Nanoarchaeota archaeon]
MAAKKPSGKLKKVSEEKIKIVQELARKLKNANTILLVSTKGLPSSQFQKIKKNLRGKAEIIVAKKSLVDRSIEGTEKGALQNLKKLIGENIALVISNVEAFELSAWFADNQSPAKAKTGDIAPEDITIEAGPTELLPGPAISELSSVGLKVAVENGKLAIKQGKTLSKKGETINEKTSNVLSKLNILPIKVGFMPVAAYDSKTEKIYESIRINKQEALEELRLSLSKALGLAINIGYTAKETISYFIAKASMEEKAIEKLIEKTQEENKNGN